VEEDDFDCLEKESCWEAAHSSAHCKDLEVYLRPLLHPKEPWERKDPDRNGEVRLPRKGSTDAAVVEKLSVSMPLE